MAVESYNSHNISRKQETVLQQKLVNILDMDSVLKKRKEIIGDVDSITTEKWSLYTFLDNGLVQRYKSAEWKIYEPQELIVFIPDYDFVSKHISPEQKETIGENDLQYKQILLSYQNDPTNKCYIVDEKGNKINTFVDAFTQDGQLFFIGVHNNKTELTIPVARIPTIGYRTFETTKFKENNEWKRRVHIGNKVSKISYKEKAWG